MLDVRYFENSMSSSGSLSLVVIYEARKKAHEVILKHFGSFLNTETVGTPGKKGAVHVLYCGFSIGFTINIYI